jgi:outer membrane protein assembly factor BamC
MLNLFLRYLESGRIDKKKPDAKVSKVASRTVLGRDKDSYPVIKLNDPLDTTWRRLGIALDRTGFLVQDRDQANRVYYVFLDATSKKSKGIFAGLFGDKEKTGRKYFQVRLAAKDKTTFVTMFDANGNKLESGDAQTLLKQLDKQLQY